MWRSRESGVIAWQARFLSVLTHPKIIACSLLFITMAAYFLISIYTSSAFDGGSGTPNDPYIISTCTQLQEIDDQDAYLYASYILANDIDCSAVVPFETIGNYQQFNGTFKPFMGRFDGQGYTISNITVGDGVTPFTGMFASTYGASIRNLNLSNIIVSGTTYVGALAGEADESSIVGVTVASSTITLNGNSAGYAGSIIGRFLDSYAYGLKATTTTMTALGTNHTSNFAGIGGLMGSMIRSMIERSTARVSITADFSGLGGIVGTMQRGSVVKDVYAESTVIGYDGIGGITGSYEANGDSYINSVYSNSSTTATLSTAYTGGILGSGSTFFGGSMYISNSFAVGRVGSTTYSGGISGVSVVMDNNMYYPTGTGQTRCVSSGAGSPGGECTTNNTSSYYNLSTNFPLTGWDFTNIWIEVSGDRPELRVFPFTEASVPVGITTCSELAQEVRDNPNGWYELSNNIDCAGNSSFLPLTGNLESSSGFYGILDGNNYTISGISMSRTAPSNYLGGLGLFTKLYGATVQDVNLSGTGVTALSRHIIGTGALAGYANAVVISNVSSSVPVNAGEQLTGGLVGVGSGSFSDISVTSDIDYTFPENQVPLWTGGVVGLLHWGKITNSSFIGNIRGYWYVGGIIGFGGLLLADNISSDGSLSGHIYVGGLMGVGGNEVNLKSSILNASSTTTLSPDLITDSSFEGIGGLVGFGERIDITNSSYNGSIEMNLGDGRYVGGLVGQLSPYFDSGVSIISSSTVNAYILGQGDNGNGPYLGPIGGMIGEAGFVEVVDSSASTTMRFGSEPASNYINGFGNVGGFVGSTFRSLTATNVSAEGSISIYEDISGVSGGYGYGLGGFGGYIDSAVIENATSSVDVYLKSFEPGAISNFVGDFESSVGTNINILGSLNIAAFEDAYTIGGLAGYATDLTIASSSVQGDITITDSWWPYDIGGLIGYLDSYSIIQQTYTDNTLSIEAGSNGTSRGPYAVGGFIGEISNNNTLRDTYASTTVSITSSALNQPTAGGNIGGYIGYVGFTDNSITSSYAAGTVTIISDITAVFQRVGGFIGWSNSGTNTYTDNFTVTSIAPIASSTNVGGFIGQYTGTETLADNYYDQTRTQQSVCSGIDAVDPAWCNAQNIAAAEPTYFFDAANPPLSTWDFTNIWLEHPDTYPTFGVSAPLGSTPPTVTTTDPATSITQTGATIAGNITSLGSGTVTARGFVYGLTPLLSATTTTNSAGFSTGIFNTGLTGLVCNTTYYFAAYASGTDGSDYGATESFTTSACAPSATPPTVSTTASASSITQTAATLAGSISNLGSATITTRGFAYGTTPALGATTTENSAGFSTGGYTTGLTSLTCNTTYYFRAYASGADGTGYGTTQNFTTTACATPTPTDDNNSSATRVKPKADTQAGVLKKTDSITICHQAGNEKYVTNTNVQVFIDLAESGYIATLRGHDGHGGDIVPSFTYDLGEGIKTYAGHNWSNSNQILHANNCELFLKPDIPSKQPPAPVPTPSTPAPPAPEPQDVSVLSCDTRSVYTQVTSPLRDGVTVKTTVPAGAVKSKKVESSGKANYALEFKVTPLNEAKSESYIEKFTGILVKYQENTDNENVPFGIEKKLKATPYTPPTPAAQTNNTTSMTLVRVESKPPCDVSTVSESVTSEQAPAAPPAQTPQVSIEEQLTIVSDILQLVDVLEWDLTNVTTPIPPFEVSVIDELGNAVTQFDKPVIMELSHPSILGSQNSIQVMQPSADGTTWYEVPFEVDGDTIRITIQNPGEFFIWFLPRTASASDEAAAAPTGFMPWLTIEFPRWLLGVASSVGLGAGLGMLLLQLSRMPIALEHLSRNLSAGLNNLIGLFTFRKRRRPWGTVYDSVTKAPVDPAYVELFDQAGVKQAEAITDLDGRYGFLVPQGSYSMMVRKTNYTFPSKLISLNGQDVIYHNLYFGGSFNVSDTVVHDVPMDPQGYDWNQHEKLRTNQTRFFHRLDPLIVRLLDLLFYLGFVAMVWQFSTTVSGTTAALLALYTVLLITRFFTGKPVLYGTVTKAGKPLSYGVLRILQEDKEMLSKVIDGYGRYVALVPNGTYTMVIEEHVIDTQYRVVLEKKVHAKHGVINGRVRIP
jgi:hypothetical protein